MDGAFGGPFDIRVRTYGRARRAPTLAGGGYSSFEGLMSIVLALPAKFLIARIGRSKRDS